MGIEDAMSSLNETIVDLRNEIRLLRERIESLNGETPRQNANDRMNEGEFAEAVGSCRATILKLRREGIIPFCRIGRKIFYLRRHIDEYFRALEQNK